MMGLSRRNALRAAAGALAAPYVMPARAADTLVVNGYGAEFQEIITRTTIEPFEKKFGVKVTYDNTGSAAQNYAKIRASRGAPGFDVAAELTPPEIILGQKEKLLETITKAEVPNLKHVCPKRSSRRQVWCTAISISHCCGTRRIWRSPHRGRTIGNQVRPTATRSRVI